MMQLLRQSFNVLAFFVILSLAVSSCYSSKEKVQKLFNKYPVQTESECVSRYPVNTESSIIHEFIPGDTVYIPGNVINCDSVIKSTKGITDTVYLKKLVHVPCPPSRIVHDTMHISEKSVIEDTRKIDLLKGQISTYQTKVDEMSKKLDKVKATRNKFIGGFLALGLGLLILLYIRFN